MQNINRRLAPVLAAAALLTGCGSDDSASLDKEKMEYIKTSVAYETICAMYNNPKDYLGKYYHIVGELYPSYDDNGEKFYSVYVELSSGGDGIGIELEWDDFGDMQDYDKITVEGRLDTASGVHNGASVTYLVLHCSMVEKRTK